MRVEDGGASSGAVTHSESASSSEIHSADSSSSSAQSKPLAAHDEGGLQSTASHVDSSEDGSGVQTSQTDEQDQLQNDVRLARTQAALSAGPKPPEATVSNTADGIVIDAGDGDDQISIDQETSSGDVTVNVNGEDHKFTGGDASRLIIRGGNGNDQIRTGDRVTVNLTIEGGDGRDFIIGGSGNDRLRGGAGDDVLYGSAGNDRIEAGEGDDVVSGGDGRDYIDGSRGEDKLYGNAGNDIIYGGTGKDEIAGNEGDDFVDGGADSDFVSGNEGDDVVSGGTGDDEVWGAEGNDVIYGGQGKDSIFGSSGDDTIYAEKDLDEVDEGAGTNRVEFSTYDSTLGAGITVTGSDEYRERVMADIDFLRSSPTGQQMLAALDASGRNITIREINDDNGYADWPNRTVAGAPQPFFNAATGRPGTPDDAVISYNATFNQFPFRDPKDPADDWRDVDPIVVLYHEMSHTYNIVNGTLQNGRYGVPNPAGKDPRDIGLNNLERQAVGLNNDGIAFDFDNDSSTPATTSNPHALTENGLRDEMGRDQRPSYSVAP